ncbi:MAG: ATP-dependent acyl-CoA ligase, partial [Leucobacter sp.]|nr:ATP-dependent acyl-CoA ligase [Leucobacter sp.]
VKATRNQWLHTGDGFIRDADGNFFFVDRQKDAIRRRGENISSFEVEACVNQHPAVLESAAVAVPSEFGEDEVMIVVVTQPGESLAPNDLYEFCASKLPKFMLPRYVRFVDALPKTPTQKVQKAKLREHSVDATTWDRNVVVA